MLYHPFDSSQVNAIASHPIISAVTLVYGLHFEAFLGGCVMLACAGELCCILKLCGHSHV